MMAAPTAPCGACFYCDRGQENLCPQAMDKMVMGAYADYLLLPAACGRAQRLSASPPRLPFEEAALLEPLSCVVHAQEMARPEPAESVLIIGAGAFGLLHMLALSAAGVREVAVAGRGADRLEWAGRARRRPRDRRCRGRSRGRSCAAQRRLRARPGDRMHRAGGRDGVTRSRACGAAAGWCFSVDVRPTPRSASTPAACITTISRCWRRFISARATCAALTSCLRRPPGRRPHHQRASTARGNRRSL